MLDKDTKDFIMEHRGDDPRVLALQAKRYPAVDIRQAVAQIEGWQAAKEKLPSWAAVDGIIYPPKISMEQCSSEATALYKASLASGASLADLTGGFGVDCSYMARGFKSVTYIERNGLLCSIAKENFALLGLNHISVVNGDSEETLSSLPHQDWIFIDPARRSHDGRKVFLLSDCEPDVVALEESLLRQSDNVMVKCSPMLDITAAARQLNSVQAIHVVAVGNECKELLFILGKGCGNGVPVHCANIQKEGVCKFSYTLKEEQDATVKLCSSVAAYLYEPNSALQKAGASGVLSKRFNIEKLHPNSQLYTSGKPIAGFPGRVFAVEMVSGFSKADIKKLQELKKANITVRNFPDTVQQLRKRLKLADGGDTYIFATTLSAGERVLLVCKKVH